MLDLQMLIIFPCSDEDETGKIYKCNTSISVHLLNSSSVDYRDVSKYLIYGSAYSF